MHYTITKVTPEMAKSWLEKNLELNRDINQRVVDKYMRDMKAGNWRLTHEAIAFDSKGRLIDGQHRLWAVVLSDTTVQMLVANGVPEDAFDHIDQGLPRKPNDVFKTQGRTWIKKDHIAIARVLEGYAFLNSVLSVTETGDAVEKHKDAIEFVLNNVKVGKSKRGIFSAVVEGAIAAAWYHESDKEELVRFITVLKSGVTKQKKDAVVILLRDFLLATKIYGSTTLRKMGYLKTCRAIKAFMNDEILGRLFATEPSPYPITHQHQIAFQPERETENKSIAVIHKGKKKPKQNVMQVTIN